MLDINFIAKNVDFVKETFRCLCSIFIMIEGTRT